MKAFYKLDLLEDAASSLSHDELLEVTKSSICTLITQDSLLSDLPPDITHEEIVSQIAVEHGQSIAIFFSRESEPPLKVIVPQNATIGELKKAFARHFELYLLRTLNKVKISWKYIWKTYDLDYEGIILDNNSSSIEEYGVVNKVNLKFKKKRKIKQK